jgi:hypothetical protein
MLILQYRPALSGKADGGPLRWDDSSLTGPPQSKVPGTENADALRCAQLFVAHQDTILGSLGALRNLEAGDSVEPSHGQRRCLGYASLRELIAVRMLLAERLGRPIRTDFPENDPEKRACQLVLPGGSRGARREQTATGASDRSKRRGPCRQS